MGKPLAVNTPAKVVLDLPVPLAFGGKLLADLALLRAEPEVYGLVGFEPHDHLADDRLARRRPAGAGQGRALNSDDATLRAVDSGRMVTR